MKNKKYVILFLFLFSNVFLFAQPFNGNGDGTAGDPYQIWNNNDLEELYDSVAYHMTNLFNWINGKHFILMADITTPFTKIIALGLNGYFHGNGKKINVEIMCDLLGYRYYSLFGGLSTGITLDSLIIDGIVNQDCGCAGITTGVTHFTTSIKYCINNATLPFGAAGIVQQNLGGTVSHCINNGSITGVDRIGGIAGNNDMGGTVINCTNTGKITATNSGTNTDIFGMPTPDNGVGGIVGCVMNYCKEISNCINIGNVEGQGMAGGIVGVIKGMLPPYPNSQLLNCINYGYVKGTNYVGGISGWTYNQYFDISNCVNTGVVEGDTDVGSIVGKE